MPTTVWNSKAPVGARITTTDGTLVTALTFAVPTNKACNIVANIIATDAKAGVTATTLGYILAATFENSAGTLAQVSTTTVLHSKEDIAAPPDAVFAVSGTNVQLNVTGDPGRTIRWSIWLDINLV